MKKYRISDYDTDETILIGSFTTKQAKLIVKQLVGTGRFNGLKCEYIGGSNG